jgi:hypothetical protein
MDELLASVVVALGEHRRQQTADGCGRAMRGRITAWSSAARVGLHWTLQVHRELGQITRAAGLGDQ